MLLKGSESQDLVSSNLSLMFNSCVTNNLNSFFSLNIAPNSSSCPLIFDSWSCFNATEAGQVQLEACPDLPDLGFDRARKAEKYCGEDGEWWAHPETNK